MARLHGACFGTVRGRHLDDAGEGGAQGAVCVAGKASKEHTPECEPVQGHPLVSGQQLKVTLQQCLQSSTMMPLKAQEINLAAYTHACPQMFRILMLLWNRGPTAPDVHTVIAHRVRVSAHR